MHQASREFRLHDIRNPKAFQPAHDSYHYAALIVVDQAVLADACMSKAFIEPAVITSYSIHYTKLYENENGLRTRRVDASGIP